MKLTQDQFRQELRKMVASPAWAELPAWFTEVMVRRVLKSNDAMGTGARAAGDVAGAAALLLAIENECASTQTQGATHGAIATSRRERFSRSDSKSATEAEKRRRAARDQTRAGGAG